LYLSTLNLKNKKNCSQKMKKMNKRKTDNSNQPMRKKLRFLINSGKTSKKILSWA
jgi:hypothetical protein